MTERNRLTEVETAALITQKMQAAALGMHVPDFWSAVDHEIDPDRRSTRSIVIGRRWMPKRAWLAPAGTALLVVVVVVAWVTFVNGDNGDDAQPTTEEQFGSQANDLTSSETNDLNGEFGDRPVPTTFLKDTLALLETAGPFRVEGELFTTSRQGGRTTSLPLNPGVAQFDSEAFQGIVLGGQYIEQDCVEHGADRVCLLVFSPQPPVDCSTDSQPNQVCGGGFEIGEPFAIHQVIGGTYSYESVFWSPDRYSIERSLTIDPEFKARVDDWLSEYSEWRTPGRSLLDDFERLTLMQQRDNRFFDSSDPAVGGYGTVVDGSAASFLADHINPFGTTQRPTDIDSALRLTDVQRLSAPDATGSAHYRAIIVGGVGESGTFEMWTRPDGLPVRMVIEAFRSPDGARHNSGETEVTRIQLNFADYGVPFEETVPPFGVR